MSDFDDIEGHDPAAEEAATAKPKATKEEADKPEPEAKPEAKPKK